MFFGPAVLDNYVSSFSSFCFRVRAPFFGYSSDKMTLADEDRVQIRLSGNANWRRLPPWPAARAGVEIYTPPRSYERDTKPSNEKCPR